VETPSTIWLEAVYRPKEIVCVWGGGLGIVNIQILNEWLLTKWIWKIYNQPNSLWVRLLKAKYMRDDNFFKSIVGNGSQF
jgi:hypothetical protein